MGLALLEVMMGDPQFDRSRGVVLMAFYGGFVLSVYEVIWLVFLFRNGGALAWWLSGLICFRAVRVVGL